MTEGDPSRDDSSPSPTVERAVDEYLALATRGEAPPLDEYVSGFGCDAAEIRRLLEVVGLVRGHARRPAAELPFERLGQYRIVREVARGGMGIVYEAIEEPLGRRVALKLLPAFAVLDARRRERFQREAQAAAALQHAAIVPVHGLHCEDGVDFFTMQFIDGRSLEDWIDVARSGGSEDREPDRWPPALARFLGSDAVESTTDSGYARAVAEWGLEIAKALDFAHRAGVLHRDVKPSNVLIDRRGRPWITDFGLAKVEGSADITESGEFVGTVRYSAPERFEGRVDARSDVYGLGATLYELLTFRPAFSASNRHLLVEEVVRREPVPPRRLRPGIPRDLETVVLKCLEKQPERRYATAADMASDLRRYLDRRPVEARRVGVAGQLVKWCQRNPAVAGLVGVVISLLAALVVSTSIHNARLRERLRATYVEQARSMVRSSEPGRRWSTLQVLDQAIEIGSGDELRDLAIDALQLFDLVPRGEAMEVDGEIRKPAYDPEGDLLAFAGEEPVFRIVDLRTGREVSRFPVSYVDTAQVLFARDGALVVVREEGRVVGRETATGSERFRWSIDGIGWMTLDAQGEIVVVGASDGDVIVATIDDGPTRRLELTEAVRAGRGQGFPLVAVSPEGDRLLVGARYGDAIFVVDSHSGEILRAVAHPYALRGVVWHPEEPWFASVSDRGRGSELRVWDADAGSLLLDARLSGTISQAPEFIGRWFVSVFGWDERTRIWDLRHLERELIVPGRYLGSYRDSAGVLVQGRIARPQALDPAAEYGYLAPPGEQSLDGAEFHPAEPCVILSPQAQIWNLATARVDGRIDVAGAKRAVFTPSGDRLVQFGRGGIWTRPFLGHESGRFAFGEAQRVSDRSAHFLVTTSDGRLALVHTDREDGRHLERIDLETGEAMAIHGPDPDLNELTISPDDRYLATGRWGAEVRAFRVWDLSNGDVHALDAGRNACGGFSPTGRHLAVRTIDEIQLWEVGTWRRVWSLRCDKDPSPSAAFSPDGGVLAYAESHAVVRLVEATTGRLIATFASPERLRGGRLRFGGPEGSYLACGPKVWDLRRIREGLLRLGVEALTFVPGER